MPSVDREKIRAYHRRWYQQNKQKRIAQVLARRRAKRAWLTEYKKTLSCQICGEDRWYCLDFHHRSDKKDIVGQMANSGSSLELLKKEIAKCDVLCANCHRAKHLGPLAQR